MQPTVPKSIHPLLSSLSILLLSQLLTSCDSGAEAIVTNATALEPATEEPVPTPSSGSGVWPAADSLAETAQPFNMQTIPYYSLAGELSSINVTDVSAISVAEFLVMVKRREGLTDSACNIVYGTTVYTEHDHDRMLAEFVNPVAIHAEVLTIIKVPNIAIAQNLLDANYIGLEVYEQLGMSTTAIEAIPLPSLSDAMFTEVRRLHELGQRPLLVLDLGKSIAELEALCEARRIHVFRQNAERLRAEACYSVAGNDGPR